MHILIKLIKKVFSDSANKNLTRVILFALVFNLLFGVLFYLVEKDVQPELTLVDSIWWAMVTMTTVGYGDHFAQTFAGRFLISYPCMLLGIGIIGYLIGVVTESMLERGSRKRKGLWEITMKNHLIICNYPGEQKILRLQEELQRSSRYKECPIVLICNSIDELPESLSKNKISFVKGDPVREDVLMQANVTECDGVFILAQNTEDPACDTRTFAIGTEIEMIERELNIPIKVVVELVSMENIKMMQRSKVDGIVSADGIMDVLIAQEFMYPGLHDVFHEVLSNASGSQFYILDNKIKNMSFGDLQKKALDSKRSIQFVGIKKNGQSIMNPDKKTSISHDDQLIILANKKEDYDLFINEELSNINIQ